VDLFVQASKKPENAVSPAETSPIEQQRNGPLGQCSSKTADITSGLSADGFSHGRLRSPIPTTDGLVANGVPREPTSPSVVGIGLLRRPWEKPSADNPDVKSTSTMPSGYALKKI
jgi:hypothetical protein